METVRPYVSVTCESCPAHIVLAAQAVDPPEVIPRVIHLCKPKILIGRLAECDVYVSLPLNNEGFPPLYQKVFELIFGFVIHVGHFFLPSIPTWYLGST